MFHKMGAINICLYIRDHRKWNCNYVDDETKSICVRVKAPSYNTRLYELISLVEQ